MRITQSMMMRSSLDQINVRRSDLYDSATALTTLKKVQKGSDDPMSFSRISRFKTAFTQNEQFQKNLTDAEGWLTTTNTALDNLHELLVQAKELSTKIADGSIDDRVRTAMLDSVQGLINEAVSQSNARYMGKSVFAGTNTTNTSPFTLQPDNSVIYSGNADTIQRRVSESLSLTINMDGQQVFDSGIFASLDRLYDGVVADDMVEVQAAFADITLASENVLTLSTEIGSRFTQVDLISERLVSSQENLANYISEDESVSLEEELILQENREVAYQAALQATSKILNLNILDYITI